ncbi:MAG: 2-amino-4-hydroxy-6-hydroxymethyldihydropteridine diphosphokinase [Acetatifactor sp.]|nr:2-amino-4-hydroxy-6-hydroxymethyldihydropteridine diphosphokinase [Acetatifactor sp.]
MMKEIRDDEIRIEQLEVFAHHGVLSEEQERGQIFQVNAVLYTNIHRAGREDNLFYSIDYSQVCQFITDWMQQNTYQLLEAVAEKLSKAILLKYDKVTAVELEIRKPEAPIPLPFGCVSVKVYRRWHTAYLAVGSNMGDKVQYIAGAIRALTAHPQINVKKVSDLIQSKPYGVLDQDDFLNGALEIETLLAPEELLDALHEIEDAAGRVRVRRWGPRTLDLDLLFYDKLVYESDNVIIPHPDLQNRDFVLEPLSTLAPNYRHPILGETVLQLFQKLTKIQQEKAAQAKAEQARIEQPKTESVLTEPTEGQEI